ncbi:MAG: hypothetical protein GY859_33395, partial [Desulfobacterales bacterium]|nr:hypothetical protein [Desulfobacterales bacterium]
MNDTKAALILGSGPCGLRASELLTEAGIDVTLASRGAMDAAGPNHAEDHGEDHAGDHARARILENAVVKSCRGAAGAFQVSLDVGGQVVDRSVGAIIVAEDHVRESNLHRHGLAPSGRVTTLTGLAEILAGDGDALAGVEKAVFITGVGHESNPVIAGEIMNAALDL